jgi:hypothetical protein
MRPEMKAAGLASLHLVRDGTAAKRRAPLKPLPQPVDIDQYRVR